MLREASSVWERQVGPNLEDTVPAYSIDHTAFPSPHPPEARYRKQCQNPLMNEQELCTDNKDPQSWERRTYHNRK